jgi:hypothetical protein
MDLKRKPKYEAMGFVEALIAIMVTGVASVVLMGISANSIRSMLQTETIDAMSQYARSGAILVQSMVEEDPLVLDSMTFDSSCYPFAYDSVDEVYSIDGTTILTGRSGYIANAKLIDPPDGSEEDAIFFRVVCLDSLIEDVTTSARRAIIRVKVGVLNNDGDITNGSDIKDYEYTSVINL